jgi:hypothetical protein
MAVGVLSGPVGRTLGILVLGVWAIVSISPGAQAQTSVDREQQIKAAFLYNFVKFVDWPAEFLPETGNVISICVFNDDPFYEALETIRDKTVKGRRLVIRRLDAVKDLESCHVAFIGQTEVRRLPQVMQSLQNSSVLTVGETERFAHSGGIINFVVEKNKVRFEINVDRAERARLKLSSQLLSLARVVRE